MRSKTPIWIYGWILLLSIAASASAQEQARLAVIVGVNEYADASLERLEYADADASGLATLLKKVGYEVKLLTDSEGAKDETRLPTKANIEAALKSFVGRTERVDTVVFAFIGHGVHFPPNADSYFCPRDAQRSIDQTDSMIALATLYSQIDGSGARVKVLLVDACRNFPNSNPGGGIDGSTVPKPPQDVVAMFSCSKGERAYEHKIVKHGLFTHFLLQGVNGEALDRDGEVTFESLAKYVKEQTERAIPRLISGDGRTQTPSLRADYSKSSYVFLSFAELERLQRQDSSPAEFTNSVGMTMKLIPAGEFLMGEKDSTDESQKVFGAKSPLGKGLVQQQRRVRIVKPFYLGTHEVTVAQFRMFADATLYKTDAEKDGWGGCGCDMEKKRQVELSDEFSWRHVGWPQTDDHPVVNISWNDAVVYCEWLSEKELKRYRLPTSAEWEYSCRGGTQTLFWFGNDPKGVIAAGNSQDIRGNELAYSYDYSSSYFLDDNDGFTFTAPVGRFSKNPFGLYDMTGNVSEWCSDKYIDNEYRVYYFASNFIRKKASNRRDPFTVSSSNPGRVIRGGNWRSHPMTCRSAFRQGAVEIYRNNDLGFRVVCNSSP